MKIWVQWKTPLSLGVFLYVGRWGFYFTPLNWKYNKYKLSFNGSDDGFEYTIGPFSIEREPSGSRWTWHHGKGCVR